MFASPSTLKWKRITVVGELWQTDLNGVTVLLLDEVNKL